MKQWIVAAALCLGALLAAGVAVVVTDDGGELAPAAVQRDDDARPGWGRGRDGDEHPGEGHGPPPWAHGGRDKADKAEKAEKADKVRGRAKPSKEWKSQWRELSPQERADRMAELAQEHAEGMREWTRCLDDDGEDCVRPLPPGQAKKQLDG